MIVVGGGPAGAALAISLARRGLRAVVLEAAPGPRWKVGESLPPSANPVLERLGLADGLHEAGLPSYGNRSVWGAAEPTERDFFFGAAGVGWRIDRRAFEAELAAAAVRAGVDWRYDCRLVGCVRRASQGWTLRVITGEGPRTCEGDVVIDASGRAARLARLLGIRRVRYDRLVGSIAYTPVGADRDGGEQDSTTLVEAVPDGWWYSLFLPGGRLATAYLTDADLLDGTGVRGDGGLLALLEAAPATRSRIITTGCGALLDGPHLRPAHTSRLAAVVGPDWLAVGEAAVAFDPLASYGIAAALGAGFYAGAAVADHLGGRAGALSAYARMIDRAIAQYLILRHDRYGVEQRWAEAVFWRRRHRPARS